MNNEVKKITVNYDLELKELLRVAGYAPNEYDNFLFKFPVKKRKTEEIDFSLLKFDVHVWEWIEAMDLMRDRGFRPATLVETLAYMVNNPDKKLSKIVLGTRFRDENKYGLLTYCPVFSQYLGGIGRFVISGFINIAVKSSYFFPAVAGDWNDGDETIIRFDPKIYMPARVC